jgi:hypothetical protein
VDPVETLVRYFEDSFGHPAEGDRCVMLAALYNRLMDPSLKQERTRRPERTRVIHKILEKTFGIPGLPKWGATAVRGNLMDNKEHIRRFIDLVNNLPTEQVHKAWQSCGKRYREILEKKHVPIALNPRASAIEVLIQLAERALGGRIQQPLCYAALSVFYESQGKDYVVLSKRVFAGDAQSGILGDITVKREDAVVAVVEVKAHIVDATDF